MHASRLFFAIAFSSAALCAAACGHRSASTSTSTSTSTAASTSTSTSTSASTSASTSTSTPTAYLSARPTTAKSIGHTSYVLKVKLDNGRVAAFKPRSTLPLGCCRYRGEIAAYRLAQALGLGNVPSAFEASFVASDLRAAFTTPSEAHDFDRKARVDPDGQVRGALMPWIDRYEVVPLERPPWRSRWHEWLMDPTVEIPAVDRALSRAISTMLVFDYVTGNWDRWSGGNVARDGATGVLLYVDNDGAFFEHPPLQTLSGQADVLRRVLRFSRGFVAALRAQDATTLREAFGSDSRGDPLLSDRVLQDADARRRTVIRIIEEQIGRTSEAATLLFD
jgi:hypothetical protein